jgi:ABC-type phosphate transport system substrate-binding protein
MDDLSKLRRRRAGRACLFLACIALALAPAPRRAYGEDSFVIIVHANNPVQALSLKQIARLFLKQHQWPDGTKAAPVNLSLLLPASEGFSRSVHGKPAAAISSYWQKMIFAGREVPPPEKASPEEVMKYVRSRRGAIGYVPTGVALDPGVKALAWTNH